MLSPLTPSRRFRQAFSLMVKAVSEETLNTESPSLKGKGEGVETSVFSRTFITFLPPT